MRIIVALFKLIVGAAFLLNSFGIAFLIGMSLSGLSSNEASQVLGGIGLYVALLCFVGLVLLTGVSAILISSHDRLCDVVAALQDRNAMLEQRGV